jgi:small-conductance mechanosensitive channel
MDQLSNWMQETLNIPSEAQYKILLSLVNIILVWIVYQLIQRVFVQRIEDARSRYQWRKNSGYVFFFIGILLVARVWSEEGFQSLFTFLGLLSAGLAIAMRDPIVNFFGWIFILWRKPFSVGDRIQIGEYAGDVVDMRVFQFSILEIGNWVDSDQTTGRVIHIPNGKLFVEPLANFSRGIEFLWNEIPILVTFESNWKKAKDHLQDIANRHTITIDKGKRDYIEKASRGYLINYEYLSPYVYTSVKDSGVLLTIRYLCEPRNRRGSAHVIWEDVLDTFAQFVDVDFAYPTRRYYYRLSEGKNAMEGKSIKGS